MATIKLTLTRKNHTFADHKDHWSSKDEQLLKFRGKLFSVGFVGRKGESRRVYQGPILPGPYAYSVPQCGAILAAEYVEARAKQAREWQNAKDITIGDIIVLRGVRFVVTAIPHRSDLFELELDIKKGDKVKLLPVGIHVHKNKWVGIVDKVQGFEEDEWGREVIRLHTSNKRVLRSELTLA